MTDDDIESTKAPLLEHLIELRRRLIWTMLAVFVAFAVFFAVSAGTARTAGIILGAIALVVLVQVIVSGANLEWDLLGTLQVVLLQGPGPLAVFTGRWMLVDV